jgi:hypothetical protein
MAKQLEGRVHVLMDRHGTANGVSGRLMLRRAINNQSTSGLTVTFDDLISSL